MAITLHDSPRNLQPLEPSLGRRPKIALNPIIEEDSDDGRGGNTAMDQQRGRGDPSLLKIEAWLSPMSDHFPTPRGIHYLSTPVLPSSPSSVSKDGSSPASSSTNMWNRVSIATENTEFEDIYDVSEEDDDDDAVSRQFQQISLAHTSHDQVVNQSLMKQPTRLIIPVHASNRLEQPRSAVDDFKKIISPVPITPSAQLPMSPAQLDFMGKQQSLDVLGISAPPSLDGSLSSEQLAAMSAPSTPVIGNDDDKTQEDWTGVHLQPDALATLQALPNGEDDVHERPSQVIDIFMTVPQPSTEMSQQPLRVVTSLASQTVQEPIYAPSPTRHSLIDLTGLNIPSPGCFFSELSPRTRTAWHLPTQSPADMPPPTSTTAEQFYRCPWNIHTSIPPVPRRPHSSESFYQSSGFSSDPVEQVIEVRDDDDDDLTDGMPTARPVVQHQDPNDFGDSMKEAPASPGIDEADDVLTEIIVDYDPDYIRKQQQEALSNLGRTELWLLAQRAYLKGVHGEENSAAPGTVEECPDDDDDDDDGGGGAEHEAAELKPESETKAQIDQSLQVNNKVVRFPIAISTTSQPKRLPPKLFRLESAYYRSFQDYIVRAQLRDVFVQQLTRFEALQAQRTGLREMHRNQLLGKYQLSVVPQSAKKRLSANVVRSDLILIDDPEKLRKEKEFEAKNQMTIPAWHVAALKFLNGGRLISAPVTKRLSRLSHVVPGGVDGVASRDRARILDLGGQSTGDWAWHCALQYPNTKIYTVTTKAIRQMSNSNIRGPPNHRQVAVERLTKLPFADDQFDLVSARELHGILKFIGENGEDEWDGCLRECMRVLKPGGYLEFSIMDSDIINAGPLGLAKSVEFGFTLKTLGYDPNPSRLWLGRLSRAGFDQVRRAWICLPLGARRKTSMPPTPPIKDNVPSHAVEKNGGNKSSSSHPVDALDMGSSDNIANVCNVVGGWSWERWLLRCEMEKVAGEMRLIDTVTTGAAMEEAGKCLDGVHAVMEEGRDCKAGFRMLNGYARKPGREGHVIRTALAD
ncbi:hypothetical protein E4U43_001110 [Claviceps pusilla]|uniref:Methyltransferase type 11 domain-containing protein n=1 Tax=Claviceps pusilla TaxID=123648 RepID=A0A9P7SZK3_9HYPO|nr:hypothetical protein E4U43_001110 [Claviceps pusilla]